MKNWSFGNIREIHKSAKVRFLILPWSIVLADGVIYGWLWWYARYAPR